jgi:acylphosphatase
MPRHHIFIRGRVQGVFFRASLVERALPAGLTGWVRNTHDGAVEAVVEGPADALAEFRAYCKKGPPSAMVREVEVIEESETGEFQTFGYGSEAW